MSKVLRLYNSFTRSINEVKLNGKTLSAKNWDGRINGSFYICGPTVYSDSHLGHAITYTRADLFRRIMKSIFSVDLTTVMNVTDIDDKILAKASEEETNNIRSVSRDAGYTGLEASSEPSNHPFSRVSERYHKSFLEDMRFIRVNPPDITIKVSQQISLIVNYIQKLEEAQHAYIAKNGDIYFNVRSVASYAGRIDGRKDINPDQSSAGGGNFKQDIRDFVLWKAAKPNEPIWLYKSRVTGKEIPGRPGWHVQCSAISSAIFGDKLDFHFGGKDLIFPHHYNEQACCCAYHDLDTSKGLHVWCSNWLHSGHLILRDEKMSKSLGNVLGIRNFINATSVNALRLLCVTSHYRADVNFNEDLLQSMQSLNHKISAFCSYLSDELRRLCESSLPTDVNSSVDEVNLDANIREVHEEVVAGICDDFDLERGLKSILDLSKCVHNVGANRMRLQDLVSTRHILRDWCTMCGLDYGPLGETHDEHLVKLVGDFRQTIRLLVVDELSRMKKNKIESQEATCLESILESCDKVRSQMDASGFVVRDKKT